MGLFGRRQARKFTSEVASLGTFIDQASKLPLKHPVAQEIRVTAEDRLGEGWSMDPDWGEIALVFTERAPEVNDEEDAYALTDAICSGYVVRWVEADRGAAKPLPRPNPLSEALRTASPDDIQARRLTATEQLAVSDLKGLFGLGPEAWDDLKSWSHFFNTTRSRARRRERLAQARSSFPATPARVDYWSGFDFGYALRCCQEASETP